MAVGAPVACQPREHQTKTVQKFRSGTEGTADARNPRPLVQCQSCRHIENLIDGRFGGLRHAPARVSRQGVQIPSGTFRVQNPQRQRRFSRSGDTGDADDFVERDVYINVFQIVDTGAADFYVRDHGLGLLF